MPQDVPLEGSETLPFVPQSLREIPDAPSFVLRTPTPRDKRFHSRMHFEEGIRYHGTDTVRREILNGLKGLWSEEQFAEHEPMITGYWDALDAFELQKRDNANLAFEYDTEIVAHIDALVRNISQEWAPLRRLLADNAEFGRMSDILLCAMVIKSWSGLESPRRLDRGYLTVDCAETLLDALDEFEEKHAKVYELTKGDARAKLGMACLTRTYLSQEEAKNFESLSLSETTPVPSTETTISEKAGKSPASTARSKKTPPSS